MNLYHLLKKESKELYNTMKIAQEIDIKLQEETLTELMLINLKSSIQNMGLNTKIKQCNKSDEFKTGTDFLWFVGSNKKKSWVAFYIQAKKLRGDQKYFLKHNYKNKTRNESAPIIRQVDKLIAAAQDIHLGSKDKLKAIPIYCFYNYLNDETLKTADYLDVDDFRHISKEKGEFSFTYTSAYHVCSLLNQAYPPIKGKHRNTFSFSELKGLPIYTLFCNTNQSWATGLFTAYQNVHSTLFGDRHSNFRFFLSHNEYIFQELPPFVESLIEDSKVTSEKYDEKDLPSYIMVTYED